MVRRGSTVRVRQRAYLKCLQIGTYCCLSIEHADTFRTLCGTRDAPRRLAASSDTSAGARLRSRLTKLPANWRSHCLGGRDLEPIPNREAVIRYQPAREGLPCSFGPGVSTTIERNSGRLTDESWWRPRGLGLRRCGLVTLLDGVVPSALRAGASAVPEPAATPRYLTWERARAMASSISSRRVAANLRGVEYGQALAVSLAALPRRAGVGSVACGGRTGAGLWAVRPMDFLGWFGNNRS
jgi:hypothetical protein